jgi:hypothetical protein
MTWTDWWGPHVRERKREKGTVSGFFAGGPRAGSGGGLKRCPLARFHIFFLSFFLSFFFFFSISLINSKLLNLCFKLIQTNL